MRLTQRLAEDATTEPLAMVREHPGNPEPGAARGVHSRLSGSQVIRLLRAAGLTPRAEAARCVTCQGVGSHAVPVAPVGECSMPVV
jgi:hypothetical protein